MKFLPVDMGTTTNKMQQSNQFLATSTKLWL